MLMGPLKWCLVMLKSSIRCISNIKCICVYIADNEENLKRIHPTGNEYVHSSIFDSLYIKF